MTAAEATSLFYELVGILDSILFGYISILSAFLFMSYFAAAKLNGWLMAIVLVLFSLTCLMFIMQFNFIKTDMENLFRYVFELKTSGDATLTWFGHNPAWTVRSQTIIQNLVTIGGYLGCIVFFFYQKSFKRTVDGNII